MVFHSFPLSQNHHFPGAMGVETRRAAAAGRHKKQPPILSHEFVIQNHGDIASAVLMIFILGLMFPLTSDLASVFILPQYNETVPAVTETGTFCFPSPFF